MNVETLEDGGCFETDEILARKPVVRLKKGFEVNDLGDGVDWEVKEKFRDEDSDEDKQQFFDTEELFQQLNYDCIKENSDSDSDTSEEKTPFVIMQRKMTVLTGDGGVHKSIVKNGTGELLSKGAICRVHYNGYTEYSDEPFDSTRLRNRQHQMKIGESFLLGFDVALATMRKGEISKFLFSPHYAYRSMGCPPRILPNAHVLFEIELVSFVDQRLSDEFLQFPEEEQKKASFENILKVAKSFKEAGNDLFNQSNHFLAMKKYNKGIQLLECCRMKDETEEKMMKDAVLVLYLNAGLCCLQLGQGVRAKRFGRKALDIDSKNIKAMYRIARGHQKEGEFEKAREWYMRILKMEPNNPDVKTSLQTLNQEVQRWKASEKQMCVRMLKQPSKTENSTKEKQDGKPIKVIPDEIKSTLSQKLQDFLEDEGQNEINFPTSFTKNEIDFLTEEAKAVGLEAIPASGKIPYLKLIKKK